MTFHKDTLYRSGGYGDNWRPVWAADDSQITPMCDGSWLGIKNYHNHLYRIIGGLENFSIRDIPNYPDFSGGPGSWFGYGVVSVDGVLCSIVSKTPGHQWSGPFRGIKLLKSKDNGKPCRVCKIHFAHAEDIIDMLVCKIISMAESDERH